MASKKALVPNMGSNPDSGVIDVSSIVISEPKTLIDEFIYFCDQQIIPARDELKGITARQRINLQKLVYINLINRFDILVDKLILWLSINDSKIREDLLRGLEKEPLSKKEFFEILLPKDRSYHDILHEKIQDHCRLEFLRDNHATKLRKLLDSVEWQKIQKPIINSNGLFSKKSVPNSKNPNCVIGFADWLYSRRNSVVHGDSKSYSRVDIDRLIKSYTVSSMSNDIRLLLSSITTAINYYKSLLNRFEDLLKESFNKRLK